MSAPQGMYDMSGWSAIECCESDQIRADHDVTPASSLTDPRGTYSSGVVFTEWWEKESEQPLLRDYRWTQDDRECEHYKWIGGAR